MKTCATPTGPAGWPLIGNMLMARRDPLAFTLHLAQDYDEVVPFHLGIFKGYLVSHPEGVGRVLRENHRNYDKRNYDYDMLRPFLGEGLLTSDGDQWLRERRLLQPAFHRDHLGRMADRMNDSIRTKLATWQHIAERGQVVDVAKEMSELALEIVASAFLGARLGERGEQILDAFQVLNHEVARRFKSLLVLPLSIPTAGNLRARRAKNKLDGILRELVMEWGERAPSESPLSRLVEAHGSLAADGSLKEILRDELITLILAGHETTASLLSWTWYLLAQNPGVASRLREEARAVLSGREPQSADLEKMVFMNCVLKEALRLYPPVWIISRRAKRSDQICGYRIPADSVVVVSPYAGHRHPDHWKEPEKFNPDRFLEEVEVDRHPFAYFPFGGGPRLCIGADFAMMEAKFVVASVLQRYHLELAQPEAIQPEPLVTLRPKGGLAMIVHSLESSGMERMQKGLPERD